MKIVPIALIVVAALAVASAVGFTSAASGAPGVGAVAPDFTLNSQENKPISLHDFKGKWVSFGFVVDERSPEPNRRSALNSVSRQRYDAPPDPVTFCSWSRSM